MWKFTLLLLATALLAVQGTYGNKLGVASSLREFLAELMEERTGVCDSYCYVEIDGTRHFFPDQFVDRNNPCIVYYCDNGRVRIDDITTDCQIRPCEGTLLYLTGVCCLWCFIAPEKPEVTPWSEWTPCSVTCGQGSRTRSRTCDIPPNAANVDDCAADDLLEIAECNITGCPVDCEWMPAESGECLPNCGGGIIERYYIITQEAANGGEDCPQVVKENKTEVIECCRDCKWEEREKGNCLPQCGGGGFKEIYYVITQTAAGGGAECPNFVHENETVVLECCAHCKWEEREKGNCLPECGGGGFKEIYYVITQQAAGGGAECPNFVHENETVVLECCENCKWEWEPWTACSKACGGTRSRGARIIEQGIAPGEVCPPYRINGVGQTVPQVESCNTIGYVECEKDEHECCVGNAMVCVKNEYKGCDHCKVKGRNKAIDWDLDSIHNSCDNCKKVVNPKQDDEDGDRVGDLCDNCPSKPNRDQIDTDYDKIGDACDPIIIINPHADEPMDYETNVVTPVDGIIQKLFEMLNGDK